MHPNEPQVDIEIFKCFLYFVPFQFEKAQSTKKHFTHHGHWPGCLEKEIRYETEYTFKVGDSGGIGDWTNNIARRFFN